jgi:ABC-2 type transport system permease protein
MTEANTGRRTVLLVARREFGVRAKDRSLLVSTGITLAILLAAILIPTLTKDDGPPHYKVGVVGTVAAADRLTTGAPADGLRVTVVPLADAATADEAVRNGDVRAALVGDPPRVVVKKDLPDRLAALLQSAQRAQRTEANLRAAGVDPAVVERASAVPALPVTALEPGSKERDANRQIALFGVFLLYGQLIGYGMWVALGVVEEKSSRVVEVLLATIRPRQLLTGKILGIGLLGFLQLLFFGAVALVVGIASDAVSVPASAAGTIGQVVLWFVLGYAFFSCAFAAAAAMVSRQEELQNATGPLNILLVASFILAFQAIATPQGVVARVFSFVPPISALVMPPRFAGGDVPLWQVLVSIAIMVAVTGALIRLAARLYEGGVLRMGGRVPMRAALAAARADRAATRAG